MGRSLTSIHRPFSQPSTSLTDGKEGLAQEGNLQLLHGHETGQVSSPFATTSSPLLLYLRPAPTTQFCPRVSHP